MKISQMLQAAYDFWRPNRYGLKKYLLNDGKKHPFALICPGGGYSMVCSFLEGMPYAKALNDRGCHALVLYYRVRKKALYPSPHDDLERAISEAFDHAEEWKLDTDSWSLWGSSAGGHLAASFCTENRNVPEPDALILTYPVIIMDGNTHKDTRNNLLGKVPSPELLEKLSVEKNISEDYPPVYVWCGNDDKLVDPENSRRLAEELERKGIPHKLEILDGIGHGVGLGDDLPWFEHAIEFWMNVNKDIKTENETI